VQHGGIGVGGGDNLDGQQERSHGVRSLPNSVKGSGVVVG
jgi:hypothetical protein